MASVIKEPIQHGQSLTGEVETVLKREILTGQYRPGERLPSERDLSERFHTSRGTVREAVKKLEQLGIVSIQPGGARVVPIEKATLDVLGTLLKLQTPPDPLLVDQVVEVFGTLMRLAALSAVDKASDEQIYDAVQVAQGLLDAKTADQHPALRRMAFTFIEISKHLVLQLVMNGMHTQFIEQPWTDHQPVLEHKPLSKIIRRLQAGLKNRQHDEVSDAMLELNRLLRSSVSKAFGSVKEQTRN